MEAQVVEVQKQTGITLPSYYNPAAMNPMKFAEQERKKKLLWGNKVGFNFVFQNLMYERNTKILL